MAKHSWPQAGWFLPLLVLSYYPFHTRRKKPAQRPLTSGFCLRGGKEDTIGIQLQLQLAAVETSLGWTLWFLPPRFFSPSAMQPLNCSLGIEFERETEVQTRAKSCLLAMGKWVSCLFKVVNLHLKTKTIGSYALILVSKWQLSLQGPTQPGCDWEVGYAFPYTSSRPPLLSPRRDSSGTALQPGCAAVRRGWGGGKWVGVTGNTPTRWPFQRADR